MDLRGLKTWPGSPPWEAMAASLGLHLLMALLVLASLAGSEAVVRLPVHQTVLLELVGEPVSKPAREPRRVVRKVHRVVALEQGGRRPGTGAAGGLSLPEREATVSLAEGGKYRTYLQGIKRRIEAGWVLSANAGEGDLMILFSVERGGRLSRVRLLHSSGNAALDASALRAVRGAGPFSPIPAAMNLDRLHVRASFCYRLAASSL